MCTYCISFMLLLYSCFNIQLHHVWLQNAINECIRTWPLKNFSERGRGQGNVILHFWEISANYSNTVKATDFKFSRHVSWDSPHMTLKNFSKRGWGQGQVTSVNFWALNANCSNTTKDTDFKFDKHVARDSLNMSPKNLSKMGVAMHGHLTPKSLGVKF